MQSVLIAYSNLRGNISIFEPKSMIRRTINYNYQSVVNKPIECF